MVKDSGSLASSVKWVESHLPPRAIVRFRGEALRPDKVLDKVSATRLPAPTSVHSRMACAQVLALLLARTQRQRMSPPPHNQRFPTVAPQHAEATRPGSLPHSGLGTGGTTHSPGQLTLLVAQAQARARAVGGAEQWEGLGTTTGQQPGPGRGKGA